MSLASIDKLIDETDYNKALSQLNLYIKVHPKEFDKAQKRIDKILSARERYTELADELLDVIQNEPENDKKKLDIISQLQSLEKHPAAEQLAFVREAKAAAEFTYYRSIYNKIMNSSSSQVAIKKYTDACDTISTGFTLYREDFNETTKNAEIIETVNSSMNNVKTAIQSYKNMQESLLNAVNNFVSDVQSGNSSMALESFKKVHIELKYFAQLRNTVAESGWELKSIFERMKKANPDLTESSFLPFAYHFILGKKIDSKTGIIGAMDSQWDFLLKKMKQSVYDTTLVYSQNIQNTVTKDSLFTIDYTSPTQFVLQMQKFAEIGKNVNKLYSFKKEQPAVYDTDFGSDYTNSMSYLSLLSVMTLKDFKFIKEYKNEKRKIELYKVPDNPIKAEREKNDLYIQNLFNSAQIFISVQNEASNELLNPALKRKIDTTSSDFLQWQGLNNFYTMLTNVIISESKKQAVILWQTAASYYATTADTLTKFYTEQFSLGQKFYNGVEEKKNELNSISNTILLKYPDKALNLVKTQLPLLDKDKEMFSYFFNKLHTKNDYQSDIKIYLDAIQKDIKVLNSLHNDFEQLAKKSNTMILLAGRTKNEADLRYKQAVLAMQRENFDTARTSLQKARTKYNESLSYQESEDLRKSSDEALQKLGDEIVHNENKVVVREVRKLKTKARESYNDGDFENADKYLTQAKNIWAQTNVDPDEEITNLAALIKTALSMKTGRVIPVTAPLYPEMSQLLSLAHQDYDNGKKLMKEGKNEDAVVILQNAKEKIQKLRLVYPLNQEASLLILRIDKLIDPDSFEEMFKRKVKAAAQDYKKSNKKQAVYTDLLDLYEINPSFPGLKQLIYNVEIEIGVRQKPVDKTDLIRSSKLSKQAIDLATIAGRNETKLRKALERVNEAIRLNPENKEAIVLKDRIQIQIGGQAAVVLSAADEAVYQKAIQALQKNNIIEANALVEQLLQNKKNRLSSKILDLQKKIKASL